MISLVAGVLLASVAAGCHRGPDQGRSRAGGDEPQPEGTSSARAKLHTLRPLLAEAERAELDVGGLFIDAGSVDLNKYTLGGWRNGWGDSHASAKGPSYISVDARAVSLRLVTHDVVQEVVLRARSPRAGQSVSILLDGKSVGQTDIGRDWSVGRVSLKARGGMTAGPHEIGLVFKGESQGGKSHKVKGRKNKNKSRSEAKSKTDSTESRAEIDWMYLARDGGGEPPAIPSRVAPLALGGRTQRALLAAPARSYSFYLQVPRNALLLADCGADGAERFTVRATTDGAESATLLEVDAAPNQWREAKVDLAPFAGQVVRLDLVSEGQAKSAGWGEPELMTPEPPTTALKGGPRKPAKNLIFLVMDTARADEFGPWRRTSPVKTPAYDALAKEGTVFHAPTPTRTGPSRRSRASLHGPLPQHPRRQARLRRAARRASRWCSEYLQEAGLRHRRRSSPTATSATSSASSRAGTPTRTTSARTSRRTPRTSIATRWRGSSSARRDKRFFLYLQTIDPHVPYRVARRSTRASTTPSPTRASSAMRWTATSRPTSRAARRRSGPDDIAWMKALYHAEVTYHDTFMGQFFEALRKNKVLDDTLVVVTNDHGEELGDHGKYGHGHRCTTS